MSKNQKLWTKEEGLFLKKQYGQMTFQRIGEHLNRSKESVNKRIIRLNLRNEENCLHKKWTTEQDTFLKENIDIMNNREIGTHLGKSPSSVATRIKILKLTRRETLRRWTEQEDEYLINYYGSKSLECISRRLQRSMAALESRLNRLGVYGVRTYTGNITVYELAKCLKVDVHTIYKWIQKKELPHKVTRAKTRKFVGIEVSAFWKWAEQNKNLLNFSKIPTNTLVPEPDWVKEQRTYDYYNRPKYEKKQWT
ncbi:helix-turn-helix domain-containing protein [Priestia megaterium]|uniref:helix-turn-helix domain-containing protein n=1 Tax=Priestia megaterium TaxID=1404 RepID=UPI001F49974D|nr:helix-turn-helix domain-containing protein [Priestia megaterium]MED3865072.1 helix-turn-helix domain-containing protein [Priestia megaterium]MED4098610.1 helix-turn-helix domain-containing protein [Priestia megaterium]MED4145769.1 helix-turn-helix domain-containing protein [Priestia megaterium]MED4168835.1 helix-turn-helix domain-containing protein [Priestia megaterium]MED4198548.1 helix-turn-helix domain-containing protein [Priestia megaterium]